MKKILILGGASGQVKLIKASKDAGYYVVLCDYTKTNPGIKLADKHYQVSTMDYDAVLEVAKKEKIDGVISNSEPAMINVAKLSEELNLVGNPSSSIETLISKDKFRNLEEKLKLFAPKHYITDNLEDFLKKLQEFKYPVIIKPVLSSGSRGTTKLESFNEEKAIKAFNTCKEFSRNNYCSIEEFVNSSINYVIEGDVFVYKDYYFWEGMFFNYRHSSFKMIPTTESWPFIVSNSLFDEIKNSIKKIFTELNITFGEYNVEMYLNDCNELFIIEINPRQGGYDIPDSIKKYSSIDFSKLLVTLAVGDEDYFKEANKIPKSNKIFTRHVVFSKKAGILEGIYIDDKIKKYVTKVEYVKKLNEKVPISQNGSDLIAFIDITFDTYENQKKYDFEMEKYIYPILKEEE